MMCSESSAYLVMIVSWYQCSVENVVVALIICPRYAQNLSQKPHFDCFFMSLISCIYYPRLAAVC